VSSLREAVGAEEEAAAVLAALADESGTSEERAKNVLDAL
jgi:hypothetical protein